MKLHAFVCACVESKCAYNISKENPNSVCNAVSTNLNDLKNDICSHTSLKLNNCTWQSSFVL